jgi:ferrous iron transport protein A
LRVCRDIDNQSHQANLEFVPVRLDQLPLRQVSTIESIDWARLADKEGKRLRELGFDIGVAIEALHHGAMKGPIACRVGRMTVALRRAQAEAVSVEAP